MNFKKAKLLFNDKEIIVEVPEHIYLIYELNNHIAIERNNGNYEEPDCDEYEDDINNKAYDYLSEYFEIITQQAFNNENIVHDGFLRTDNDKDNIDIIVNFYELI